MSTNQSGNTGIRHTAANLAIALIALVCLVSAVALSAILGQWLIAILVVAHVACNIWLIHRNS